MPAAELTRVMVTTRRIAWAHVREMRRLASKKAQARKAAKIAYAKALLEATGPVAVRQAIATLAAADAQFDFGIAEELISTERQALAAAHDDFEAIRSINADQRADRAGGPS